MSLSLRAGQFRHTMILEEPGKISTTGHKDADDWGTPATVATVRCAVRKLSGREQIESNAGVETRNSTHEIGIRYRAGVTNRMRLKFGSRFFYIEDIDNVEERNRELVLICRESVK